MAPKKAAKGGDQADDASKEVPAPRVAVQRHLADEVSAVMKAADAKYDRGSGPWFKALAMHETFRGAFKDSMPAKAWHEFAVSLLLNIRTCF